MGTNKFQHFPASFGTSSHTKLKLSVSGEDVASPTYKSKPFEFYHPFYLIHISTNDLLGDSAPLDGKMRPRRSPARNKRKTLTRSRNLLARAKRGRRPQKIIHNSRRRRNIQNCNRNEEKQPSTEGQPEGTPPAQAKNTTRREKAATQKHKDTFFERITHPFRTLRFPFTTKSHTPAQPTDLVEKSTPAFPSTDRKRHLSNTYNPYKAKPSPGKRMVILDGSNIAHAHSCNKHFSVKGIKIALEYFEKMGHEVKAVVPQHRLCKSAASDPELLESLHHAGKIVLTPCKNLPGKSTASYDDRFTLQLAVEFDAVVVSNDDFNDLITENKAFKKVIETRVIGYTWCKDMFMLPEDPYGRDGPTLSTILNRPG